MNRPLRTWLVFAVAAGLGIAAMTWVTRSALHLERREAETRAQAAVEERVRLALWRMESILAPLIAQEAARPASHYRPFLPADRLFDERLRPLDAVQAWLPSPLQRADRSSVRLHFEVDARGRWTSPREGEASPLQQLQREVPVVAFQALPPLEQPPRPKVSGVSGQVAKQAGEPVPPKPTNATPASQQTLNDAEFLARQTQVMSNMVMTPMDPPKKVVVGPRARVRATKEGPFQPLWMGSNLFLVRRAWIDGEATFQGCWLDWPGLEATLLGSIRDLLPGAKLRPAAGEGKPERRLAGLPVLLEPGVVGVTGALELTPLRLALLVGWGCALLGGLAIAVLMQQALALSERRGAFVSAVTHELRTPLTTFRMFAEMLSMGMARDEAERQSFLDTLVVESDRLDHLVKNVLAYARLESQRSPAQRVDLSLEDLLARSMERLSERASQAGLELLVEMEPQAAFAMVRTDPGPVEQILFNLVDNACKYAAGSVPAILHLQGEAREKAIFIRVRDHGPGLVASVRARLFKPFSKSVEEASRSAPGVGLGLSLCRRLARNLGGDLVFETQVGDGTSFVLQLPTVTAVPTGRHTGIRSR